jgi:hypothetical protein
LHGTQAPRQHPQVFQVPIWKLSWTDPGFSARVCLPPGAARLSAYQKDAPPTFTTDLNVVSLLVTVRDKYGALVKGLTKDDFTLLEDGRSQVIRYFTQETNQPLILGLLVDTSGSERRMIGEEREASDTFLRAGPSTRTG